MNSFPMCIYDKHRPGLQNDQQAKEWRNNREVLENIIHRTLNSVGAVLSTSSLGDTQDQRALGDASIIEASRAEPPMAPEEARDLGGAIVDQWSTQVNGVGGIAVYCDTVFALPSGINSTPTL